MPEPPKTLGEGLAQPVELDLRLGSWRSVWQAMSFVRAHRIKVVYLADRPAWHVAFIALRAAGVRWIVVHDHTSGERTTPWGLKRMVKQSRNFVRWGLADQVVAVSDFVAQRKIEVDRLPGTRVRRIWNSLPEAELDPLASQRLRLEFGLGEGPVVVCACRATPEKGVSELFRAFDRYVQSLPAQATRPSLVYLGDGPGLADLQALHRELRSAESIVLAGYRPDALELLGGADVCVAPSLWQEAFGLAGLEPMAFGIPVIASKVGGIPEVVLHEETGLLTEPGDQLALESALRRLLESPAERKRLGCNGQRRARQYFGRAAAMQDLIEVIGPGFSVGTRQFAQRNSHRLVGRTRGKQASIDQSAHEIRP